MTWALSNPPTFSDTDFYIWQSLLEKKTGISFENHKHILQTGLTQRMRELGFSSYSAYFREIQQGSQGALEWESLLRTLTVKETRFFRDPDAFNAVRRYIFKLVNSVNTQKTIDVWSAACSTGEEAYSLAMLVNDCLEGLSVEKYLGITATDICLAALAEARKGVYNERKANDIAEDIRNRYCLPHESGFFITQKLQQKICFLQANLINFRGLPLAKMDVIFCQNVLIYFKRDLQHRVLDQLVNQLKPGGLLVLGSGEALGWKNNETRRLQDESVKAYIRKQ